MTTYRPSLTEFLLARIAEDEAREVAEDRATWLGDLPDNVYVDAAQAHERATITQAVRLSHRLRALGWAYATSIPFRWLGFGRLAHMRAMDYADHPDYREEWKP